MYLHFKIFLYLICHVTVMGMYSPNDWWAMQKNGYFPYTGKASKEFILTVDKSQQIDIVAYAEASVFLNDNLISVCGQSDTCRLTITQNGILRIIQKSASPPPIFLHAETELDQIRYRRKSYEGSAPLIFGLMLMSVFYIGLRKTNSMAARDFFNPDRVFVFSVRADYFSKMRGITPEIMSYTLYLAFISTIFLLWYFDFRSESHSGYRIFNWNFFNITLLTLSLGSIYLIRYFWIKSISSLFGLSGFGNYHYVDYLKISSFIVSIFLLFWHLIMVYTQNWHPASTNVFITIYALISVIRGVFIFFKLITYSSHRKLYLFLYLCISETIPLLIGIKVVESI